MSKNRLDYTANLGRHDHDVTAGFTSSITTGPIVPQYFDILGPGDKIFYRTHMFCRFQHMPTAFLGEIDLHLDYFFVPLQMLYTAFGQVFAQTNDVISDFFEGSDFPTNPDTLPIMDLNNYFSIPDTNYSDLVEQKSPYCGESFLKGTFRLLDSLDITPLVIGRFRYLQDQQLNYDYNYNTFPGFPAALLAYQAIYQKHFRNEELEKFDISSFNVDTTSMMANKKIPETQYRRFLTLRYSGRPNDYFTNVRFSPIATSINSLAVGSNDDSGVNGGRVAAFGELFKKVNNFLSISNSSYTSQEVDFSIGGNADNANKLQGPLLSALNPDPVSYVSAQNIRATFALDKYLRVYGRAGKTYDDQILAHFGVNVPHDVKHDITHLKHYRMVLQTDPVVSTADTEQGNVGSVGGQLAAQLDTDEVSFRAPVHGVFMCVARLIPRPRYFMTNSRLHAISERLSFPIPEFDKLGAQPVYTYEYGLSAYPGPTQYLWKNRYSEFKEKYNRCSITYAHDISGLQGVNFFSPWVVSKKPYNIGSPAIQWQVLFSSFFVQPNDLDNVMVTKYQLGFPELDTWIPNPHIVLQTDPVLTEFACFAKKVSWMSPSGEPDL